MLYVAVQAWYAGGVAGVDPVWMLVGAYEGQTGENPGYFKIEPLELDNAGKTRKDGIQGQASQQEKKALQVKKRPGNPSW